MLSVTPLVFDKLLMKKPFLEKGSEYTLIMGKVYEYMYKNVIILSTVRGKAL
jgi:hypothetical protein